MPAKALRWLPPIVSMSTSNGVADSSTPVVAGSSARVTLELLFSIAKLPCRAAKPKALMFRFPLACSSSPLAPSMLSFRLVLGPVRMLKFVLPAL